MAHEAPSRVVSGFADGDTRSRLVWITDVLPNDLAPLVEGMVEHGCAAIKQTLELSVHA